MKRLIFSLKVAFIAVFFIASLCFAGSQQTSSTSVATLTTQVRYYLNEASASFWADAEILVWINDGILDIVSRTRCLEAVEETDLTANTLEYAISSNYIDVTAVIYHSGVSTKKGLLPGHPSQVGNIQDPGEPVYWYEWAGKVGVYPFLTSVSTDTTHSWSSGTGSEYYTALATECIRVEDNGTAMTHNDGGKDSLSANQWDWDSGSSGRLYVRLTADADPSGHTISAIYEAIDIYYVSRPTDVSTGNITVPSHYDQALVYYVVAQGFLKDRQLGRYNQLMTLYYAELDKFRTEQNENVIGTKEDISQ